mgnify:CR=1 FL=1
MPKPGTSLHSHARVRCLPNQQLILHVDVTMFSMVAGGPRRSYCSMWSRGDTDGLLLLTPRTQRSICILTICVISNHSMHLAPWSSICTLTMSLQDRTPMVFCRYVRASWTRAASYAYRVRTQARCLCILGASDHIVSYKREHRSRICWFMGRVFVLARQPIRPRILFARCI